MTAQIQPNELRRPQDHSPSAAPEVNRPHWMLTSPSSSACTNPSPDYAWPPPFHSQRPLAPNAGRPPRVPPDLQCAPGSRPLARSASSLAYALGSGHQSQSHFAKPFSSSSPSEAPAGFTAQRASAPSRVPTLLFQRLTRKSPLQSRTLSNLASSPQRTQRAPSKDSSSANCPDALLISSEAGIPPPTVNSSTWALVLLSQLRRLKAW